MSNIYITGDKHADFTSVLSFCKKQNTSNDDILIVLGDAGINYYANELDNELKKSLSKCQITFFCVHGNHEERPENISSYKIKKFYDGIVFYEEEYPNILFAKDGEIYNFNDKKTLVIGGAYSVDKYYRLSRGYHWYESEQPSEDTKSHVIDVINGNENKVDVILTHTCPYKYMPYEVFLSGIDQSTVDNSTEKFLDKVEELCKYKKWYCGHFHTEKQIDKIEFMYNQIKEFYVSNYTFE